MAEEVFTDGMIAAFVAVQYHAILVHPVSEVAFEVGCCRRAAYWRALYQNIPAPVKCTRPMSAESAGGQRSQKFVYRVVAQKETG